MMNAYNVDDAWLQERLARSSQRKVALQAAALMAGIALIATFAFQAVNQPTVAQFAVPTTSQTVTSALRAIPTPQSRSTAAAPESFEISDFLEEEAAPLSVYTVPAEGPGLMTVFGGLCMVAGAALALWRRSDLVMMPVTGVVKWFNSTKGYGFITPDDGSPDIFVHQTAINSEGFRSLDEGSRVEYDVVTEGGKVSASNVSSPGGAPVQASRGGGGGGGGKGKGGKGRRNDDGW